MNHQEAKLILQAYRCDGADAADPLFAEALELARLDPVLGKWFREQQALDERIQNKLPGVVPVPPRLKADLLALQKVMRPAPWWSRRLNLAAAAAVIALALAAVLLVPQKPAALDAFRQAMTQYSLRGKDHIVFASHDLTQVQQWLQSHGMPSNLMMPAGLPGGTTHGCRIVDWKGHRAAMICFVLDHGEHLDLFVINRDGMADLPATGIPRFADAGGLHTATWIDSSQIYLLMSNDKTVLEKVAPKAEG